MNTQNLTKAHKLHQQAKFKEALEIYYNLLEEHQDNIELWHAVAVAEAQLKNYTSALQAVDKAIALELDNAALHNSRGNILMALKMFSDAEKSYRSALKYKPTYAIAQSNLANSLYRLARFEASEKSYQRAIKLDPSLVDAHYNYAILCSKLSRFNEAIEKLKTVIKLNANYHPAYGQLAEIYLQQKDYNAAIDYFKLELKLKPNADSWHHLGQAYLKQKQFEKAISALEQAIMLNPKHQDCYHDMGNACLQNGDRHKALNYFLRQLSIRPEIESYYNIGVIFMTQNRFKEAIQYLQHAAKQDPSYLPTHLNLGALFLKVNAVDKAIAHYKQALKLSPNNKEIMHIIAALSKDKTPDAAPAEYVQNLFDQYATYYDKHLMKHLSYQAPERLYNAIVESMQLKENDWITLDLGCGTGLMGERLKSHAKHLIGIDLSKQMVAKARQKNIYQELRVADILEVMPEYHNIDLIVAADVLPYLGDLSELVKQSYHCLKTGGLLAFTIEKTTEHNYVLQETVRYAHSKAYLNALANNCGFKTECFENLVLRKHHGKNVEGYLVIFKK